MRNVSAVVVAAWHFSWTGKVFRKVWWFWLTPCVLTWYEAYYTIKFDQNVLHDSHINFIECENSINKWVDGMCVETMMNLLNGTNSRTPPRIHFYTISRSLHAFSPVYWSEVVIIARILFFASSRGTNEHEANMGSNDNIISARESQRMEKKCRPENCGSNSYLHLPIFSWNFLCSLLYDSAHKRRREKKITQNNETMFTKRKKTNSPWWVLYSVRSCIHMQNGERWINYVLYADHGRAEFNLVKREEIN